MGQKKELQRLPGCDVCILSLNREECCEEQQLSLLNAGNFPQLPSGTLCPFIHRDWNYVLNSTTTMKEHTELFKPPVKCSEVLCMGVKRVAKGLWGVVFIFVSTFLFCLLFIADVHCRHFLDFRLGQVVYSFYLFNTLKYWDGFLLLKLFIYFCLNIQKEKHFKRIIIIKNV